MSFVIVATIRPKADQKEAVLEALKTAAAATHQEPGCEVFAIHESREELVIIESWADKDSLKAHETNEAFLTLIKSVSTLLSEPLNVRVLRPVIVGDPAKGALA